MGREYYVIVIVFHIVEFLYSPVMNFLCFRVSTYILVFLIIIIFFLSSQLLLFILTEELSEQKR